MKSYVLAAAQRQLILQALAGFDRIAAWRGRLLAVYTRKVAPASPVLMKSKVTPLACIRMRMNEELVGQRAGGAHAGFLFRDGLDGGRHRHIVRMTNLLRRSVTARVRQAWERSVRSS